MAGPATYDSPNLPYSLEAEQAVLGAILIDSECMAQVADILKSEHFYLPEHQAVYSVMLEKMVQNQAIDFVTVLNALQAEEYFAGEEGKAYLLKLTMTVPAVKSIENYARIVRQKYDVRALIRVAREITEDAMDPASDPADLLDAAEQKIYDIRDERPQNGLVPIKDAITGAYETFNKLISDQKDDYVGIPTGISALDAITTGLNKSDLIIVGARPGMGKTAFVLNIARNVAVLSKRKVAVFNLEMSREQMVHRFLSTEAHVSVKKMRTGTMDPDEWSRVGFAAGELCQAPIYLDDTPTITVPEMMARLRRLKNVGLVIVDYLQLMKLGRRMDNRVQEVAEITRSLKIMAKELHVPVMVCAQLSRATDKDSKTHRPALSDLRESGSIEQDADQVLFLYRDEYYINEKKDPSTVEMGTAEVIVAKNRHGEQGTVKLAFLGEFTQFTSLETNLTEG